MKRRTFSLFLAGFAASVALPSKARAETILDKIRKTGEVTVATEAAYPPMEYVENGKIVGYGKDLLDKVVAAMGVKLVQLDLPFQGILPGLLAKKFDFAATSLSLNAERAKRYAYTLPIVESPVHAIKRAGDTGIANTGSLNGKVVGAQLGSSVEGVTRKLDAQLKEQGGSGFKELKLYPSYPEAYVALANGEIDAVFNDLVVAAYIMKQRPGVFERVDPAIPGDPAYQFWVTRPEDLDLRDFINSVIRKLRDNGELAELQRKWFGVKMNLPDGGYLPPGAF